MKLKSWVVTTLISLLISFICVLTVYTTTKVYNYINEDNNSYVLKDIAGENVEPVAKEIVSEQNISKPFDRDDIYVVTNYYNKDDTRENQEKSLVLFGNTYMPSTGILYGSEKEFDVLSIYQGEVTKIEENEAFGTTIEIKHDNDIISKYSSVKDVKVSVGDIVSIGDPIAKSGENKVVSTCKNMLYFELISKGNNINPDSYYGIDINKIG